MSSRRLIPLGLLVAVLLAAVGVASHGRPLAGGHRGTGPTATFFDYFATTVVLIGVVFLAVAVYAVVTQRGSGGAPRRGRWHLLTTLLAFALSAAVALLILHTGFLDRLRRLEGQHLPKQTPSAQHRRPLTVKNTRNARLRWDEIAVFVVLVAGTSVMFLARRRKGRPPRPWSLGRSETVAAALDESIDDLRTDPDLRRAIIAAYARMEYALGRGGLPRRPSEAPFEYIERALRSLETSAESAERLTALFEWAKFSHHEPEPEMRDDAIAALLAVREDLAREPVTV